MSQKEAERDYQLRLYLLFMRKVYKNSFDGIMVTWNYIRLRKELSLRFACEEIDKTAAEAEAWIMDNKSKITAALHSNDFPCTLNKYCDNCEERLTSCTLFANKVSTDIEKPAGYLIKDNADAMNVYMFVKALRYKADVLNAKLKAYVDAKGNIDIGNGTTLGSDEEEDREYDAKALHGLLLEKGVNPDLIYKFTSVTRSDADKLLSKANLLLTEVELDTVSTKKIKKSFGLMSPE